MAFENFPYSNFHEINLDWILEKVKAAYSASNPPDYPVTSVNGQTGDVIIAIPANMVQSVNGETGVVILYRNPLTQFPATDEQRWNLFRICDGSERGIEFDEDGAHRIEGVRRILIYDEENQPDYPVTSVNGQTGDVHITAGVNSVNGKTGNVVTPFVNPNADILTLDSNSNTVLWGISRNVAGGNVALYISSGAGSPQAFIRFTPEDGEPINLPLLSSADIPTEAGVISVNGATGVVSLYGTNINTTDASQMSINTKLANIDGVLVALTDFNMVENNTITWESGTLHSTQGTPFSTPNAIRTDYLPNNIVLIAQKNREMNFRIYAYENNEYIGLYHPNTNTFSPVTSSATALYNISTFVNMQKIRQSFPDYSFKLSASSNPQTEITPDAAEYVGLYGLQESDISQLQADVQALQAADTTHSQQITALQAADTTHGQQITELQAADTTHGQQITALQNSDTAQNQQISELQSADTTHNQQITDLYNASVTQGNQINDLYTRTGIYTIYIANVNSLPLRYPASGTDPKIKNTNMVVSMDMNIPGAQLSDWTITTYDGYLEIAGSISGVVTLTLYLA